MKTTAIHRKCLVQNILIVVFSWSLLGAVLPAQAQLQAGEDGVSVYREDFSSYVTKDFSENVEWDIWEQDVSLSAIDGITQETPVSALDRDGNLVVVWVDPRGDSQRKIFAQKIDPNGDRLWQHDVQVNAMGTNVDYYADLAVEVAADNHIVIIWAVTSYIYVQELGPNGEKLLPGDHVLISTSLSVMNINFDFKAVPDGGIVITWSGDLLGIHIRKFDSGWNPLWLDKKIVSFGSKVPALGIDHIGNVLITWSDCLDEVVCNNGFSTEINAMKMDSAGTQLWATKKNIVTTITHFSQSIAVDSQNNFVIAWSDYQHESGNLCCGTDHIYAQKINPDGIPLWGSRGKRVSSHPKSVRPGIWIDAQDRVYFSWDLDFPTYCHVFAQSLDPDGSLRWSEAAINRESQCDSHTSTSLVVSPDGRSWVTWLGRDVFTMKLDPKGQALWQNDLRINEASSTANQIHPAVASAPGNQTYIAWVDDRRKVPSVYLQKYDQDGAPLWGSDVLVNQNILQPASLPSIAVDANGNVTVVWAYNYDYAIYMQRIGPNGNKLWENERYIGNYQGNPLFKVVVDIAGNSQVAWPTSLGDGGILTQKFNLVGNKVWADPILIGADPGLVIWELSIAIDSQNNLYAAWNTSPAGGSNYTIFLYKLDANGVGIWSEPARLTRSTYIQRSELALDPQDNPILVWSEAWRTIFARKYSPSGQQLSPEDVLVLSTDFEQMGGIAADDQGNIIITFTLNDNFVYARKVNASGQILWPVDVPVSSHTRPMRNDSPVMTTDSTGNAWIVWRENGVVNGETSDSNIYFQKVSLDAQRTWPEDVKVVEPEVFFEPSGVVQSRKVNIESGFVRSASLTTDVDTSGGSVSFYLTVNGGVDWLPITPGGGMLIPQPGNDMRWKAVLSADACCSHTPTINTLEITYSYLPPKYTYLPFVDK